MCIDLSISYSSLSMFKKSPLEYFFAKIIKEPPEKINSSYGDAGSAVHKALDSYLKNGNSDKVFEEQIKKVDLHGIHGETLNIQKFRDCYEKGKKIIDEFRADGYTLVPEMKIEYTTNVLDTKLKVVGYIDVVAKKGEEVIILDWKTNSSVPEDGFIGQQEFYTYLYYTKFKKLPKTFIWYMLKNGNKLERQFGLDTVKKIETEIENFVKYINDRGTDVELYDEGNYEHIFNEHFTSCRNESMKRKKTTYLDIEIFRNKLIFINLTDIQLQRALDIKFSYQPEGYQYSPKYQAGEWDGKIHLFKTNKCPIGFYWLVQEFISKYNERFKTNYKLRFIDKRNEKVKEYTSNLVYSDPPFKLRKYQDDAIIAALNKKIGIIYSGTASGKTAIMAELCKQINKRSLIIINRLELIDQTAEAFNEYLGVDIGVMHEGNLDINNDITIASVQTIGAILKRNDDTTKQLITYLYNVNAILYDECQNVKDKSFYSVILEYAVNTEYILGFSGTPFRNPKSETILMETLVGGVIFTKTTGDLEKEGWIVPTKTYFLKYETEGLPVGMSYKEAYDNDILNNETRNNLLLDVVNRFKNVKKIIILTKYRAHNKLLLDLIPNSICIDSFTPRKQRREIFDKFKNNRDIILISTVQLMASGINIPDMDMIINASASKSPIMVAQSIGRVKRSSPGKRFGVFIDFYDNGHVTLRRATKTRIDTLEEFKNKVEILRLEELDIDKQLLITTPKETITIDL